MMARALLFFHCALQWMTVLAREIYHLRHLRLSDFVCIDTTYADALVVNMEHDLCGVLATFVEKFFENVDNKFHRCVIVVQKQYLIEARFLGFGTRLGNETGTTLAVPVIAPAVWVMSEPRKQMRPPAMEVLASSLPIAA